MTHSIYRILEQQANRSPDAGVLRAPGRPVLTYDGLLEHINATVRVLLAAGLNRNDRVAIVLPNGPEMATAFIAAAVCATAAPLNPSFTAKEFAFYLSDLRAKALLVQAGDVSPALGAAQSFGIPVIEIFPSQEGGAGVFGVKSRAGSNSIRIPISRPDDSALVLHTSGTTAKPKIVPLTQANICRSARNIRDSLSLVPEDTCLNVMPLFHIHGLMASLLASLTAGASIVCAPGFQAPKFFEWFEDFRPTWFTAVPTMHQSILKRAHENRDRLSGSRLRFIRSCSSALHPKLMSELEESFRVPVIEAYGMTEASHQIASNPLPPGKRRPGSVGIATGQQLAIMNETGTLLRPGENGEIVTKGENVTRGYDNNPDANRAAFADGWFRTGDEGYFDEDQYLFITGRPKEIINRGGEKISPREVDETLMEHPGVSQAVTFAVPDLRMGEEIAAAVVLRAGVYATEREIQDFAAARLADFKIPRKVFMVDQIPKGPTGKLQRLGLAETLGLTTPEPPPTTPGIYREPVTRVEQILASIWVEVLEIEKVGTSDLFLDLGGDSILATQIIARVRSRLQVEVGLNDFFNSPTVADMARIIEAKLLEETNSTAP